MYNACSGNGAGIDFGMYEILTYLNFSFLILHEIDAVRAREWMMLPIMRRMDDSLAYYIFLWVHLPLIILLLYGLNNDLLLTGRLLHSFALIHLLLHFVFKSHPENRLNGTISRLIIIALAIVGFLGLAINSR